MPRDYTSIPEQETPEAFLSLVVPSLLPTHSKGCINNRHVLTINLSYHFWLFKFLACDYLDLKYPPKVLCARVRLLDIEVLYSSPDELVIE